MGFAMPQKNIANLLVNPLVNMSHISVNSTFLLHLSSDQINLCLVSLLEQGVDFEILNPQDLGSQSSVLNSKLDSSWKSVIFYEVKIDEELNQKMQLLDKILQKYSSSFTAINQKCEGSVIKKLEHWKEVYLQDIINKLSKNSLVYHKDLIKRGVLKSHKIGDKLVIIDDLKALYTKYEIQKKANYLQSQFFKLNKTTNAAFGFISVPEYLEPLAIGVFSFLQIDYELVVWEYEIVDWNNRGSYVGYQNLIKQNNPYFRLNSGLAVINPTKFFACFSIFFTALVISDIWAGFVIVLISGCLSLLQKKIQLKHSIIYTQIWTGLLATIFGVILGRFGGNLLTLDSIIFSNLSFVKDLSNVISSFQLISLYEVKNKMFLPLNQLIAMQNWNLDVVFVSGFIIIILIVLLLSYLFDIQKKFRQGEAKKSSLSMVFTVNIILLIGISIGFVPFWVFVIALFLLFIFQIPLSLGQKARNFVTDTYGLAGLVGFIFKFSQLFSLLLLTLVYEIVTSFLNHSFILGSLDSLGNFGSLFGFVFVHTLVVLIFWQISFKVVNKLFLNYFLGLFDNPRGKIFDSVGKYKWWQF